MIDTVAAIKHLRKSDQVLATVIRKVGPCKIRFRPNRTPFRALVEAVAHQQLNGTAAATILGRVKKLYPGRVFPSPQEILDTPDRRLREAGLSRAKTAALKDLATKTLEGHVPGKVRISKMAEEEIIERLTSVRGVGPWTVEMLLIFTLGRQDVLPVTDFGVRKGFQRAFGLREMPSPKELLAHGERWRPHRSTAAWYLWRASELPE
jgi:DNA-3-methyladenine glycosylase II